MKGVITIFCLPQELEDLALTLNRLKRNSVYLDDSIKFKIDITMCLSDELTDWENTKLPKEYIKNRTIELVKKYLDWCEYELLLDSDNILGCVSQRRHSFTTNPEADFFIWLDTDIFFKDTTLFYMQEAYKTIISTNLNLFIITPEFVRQWDDTWDVIINEKYQSTELNYHLIADIYKESLQDIGDIDVIELPCFKFAGGWFTLITKSLLDKINIPESFGHYGLEDTFIMFCSQAMKQNNKNVKQFKLLNLIAGEMHKTRTNQTLVDFIKSKNRKDEFRKIAEDNFGKEYQQFLNKLNV
jgi:hypothetical protein